MQLRLIPTALFFLTTGLPYGHAFPAGSRLVGTSCGTYALNSVHGTQYDAAASGESVVVTDATGAQVTSYVPGAKYTVTASSTRAFKGFLIGTTGGSLASANQAATAIACPGGDWVAQVKSTAVSTMTATWTAPTGAGAVTLGTSFVYNTANAVLIKTAPLAVGAAAANPVTAATAAATVAAGAGGAVTAKPTTTVQRTGEREDGNVATAAPTLRTNPPSAAAVTNAPAGGGQVPATVDPNAGTAGGAAAGGTGATAGDAANLGNAGTTANNNALNLMGQMSALPAEILVAVAVGAIALVLVSTYFVMKRRAAAAAAAAASINRV